MVYWLDNSGYIALYVKELILIYEIIVTFPNEKKTTQDVLRPD